MFVVQHRVFMSFILSFPFFFLSLFVFLSQPIHIHIPIHIVLYTKSSFTHRKIIESCCWHVRLFRFVYSSLIQCATNDTILCAQWNWVWKLKIFSVFFLIFNVQRVSAQCKETIQLCIDKMNKSIEWNTFWIRLHSEGIQNSKKKKWIEFQGFFLNFLRRMNLRQLNLLFSTFYFFTLPESLTFHSIYFFGYHGIRKHKMKTKQNVNM